MSDAICEWIVQRIDSGEDVRIEAAAAASLSAVAARLRESWNVVSVTARPNGLSLSALIAQLSGRENFDDQDDAALEIGFRRLVGLDRPDRRTVLLLDVVRGVQRPVLRYLQQVSRSSHRLSFAIAAGPDLDTLLAEPGLARLRARVGGAAGLQDGLKAPEPVATVPPPPRLSLVPPLPVAAVAVAPITTPPEWTLDVRPPVGKRRRGLLWTASGFGMVASTALGAWLGQAHTVAPALRLRPTIVATDQRSVTAEPERAVAPVPVLAKASPAAEPIVAPTIVAMVAPKPPLAAADSPAPVDRTIPALADAATPEHLPLASAELAELMVPISTDTLAGVTLASRAEPDLAVRPSVTAPHSHEAARKTMAASNVRRARAFARRLEYARLRPSPTAEAERLASQAHAMPLDEAEAMPLEDAGPVARRWRAPSHGYGLASRSGRDDAASAAQPFIGTFSTIPSGARLLRPGP